MKTVLLFLVCLFIAGTTDAFAQSKNDTLTYEVVAYPDVEATFPGGAVEMQRFMIENLVVPDSIIDLDLMGKIYCQFDVAEDGTLTDIHVLRSQNEELSKAVIEMLEKMPKWIPAETNGEVVRSRVNLPINIHFQ